MFNIRPTHKKRSQTKARKCLFLKCRLNQFLLSAVAVPTPAASHALIWGLHVKRSSRRGDEFAWAPPALGVFVSMLSRKKKQPRWRNKEKEATAGESCLIMRACHHGTGANDRHRSWAIVEHRAKWAAPRRVSSAVKYQEEAKAPWGCKAFKTPSISTATTPKIWAGSLLWRAATGRWAYNQEGTPGTPPPTHHSSSSQNTSSHWELSWSTNVLVFSAKLSKLQKTRQLIETIGLWHCSFCFCTINRIKLWPVDEKIYLPGKILKKYIVP